MLRKNDEVRFRTEMKNGRPTAVDIYCLPFGTLHLAVAVSPKVERQLSCRGYVLLEPSHTTLGNTPSRMEVRAGTGSPAAGGGRWDNVTRDKGFKSQTSGSNTKEEGVILLISDPGGAFSITFGGKKGLRLLSLLESQQK